MDYLKRCPKCGAYMTPHLGYKFGYVYTDWTCSCGYFESTGSTSTTYSDNTAVTLRNQSSSSDTSNFQILTKSNIKHES